MNHDTPEWSETLCREWNGTKCGVCGQDKWAFHPFCRSCSIRLQRVGLMKRLKPVTGHSFEAIMRFQKLGPVVARMFDLSRDYLIVSRREKLEATEP